MNATRCPICGGRGIVYSDLYDLSFGPSYTSSAKFPVTCRACGGRGVIVSGESAPVTERAAPARECYPATPKPRRPRKAE